MSVGYAQLLSSIPDVGGTLGTPEEHEGARAVLEKMKTLSALVRRRAVVVAAPRPAPLLVPRRPRPHRLTRRERHTRKPKQQQ